MLNARMDILRKGLTAYEQKKEKQHQKRKPDFVQLNTHMDILHRQLATKGQKRKQQFFSLGSGTG